MATTPTLKTIEKLITNLSDRQEANHKEVQDRLKDVEAQVKYTNGRVKALETAEAVAKGIAEDRAQREQKREWGITAKIGAFAALGAVIGGLWWVTELINTLRDLHK